MVRIRLRRVGARHQPSYRIVATEKENPATGTFLEILGHYNPRTQPATVEMDEAKVFRWMRNGAQPSDSVVQIMKTQGAWDRWERVKAGEEIDTVVAAAGAKPEVDARTRRDDGPQQRPSKKSRAKSAQEEASQSRPAQPAVAEPVVEVAEAEPPSAEVAGEEGPAENA
jgi:small subunit ribosomal protein S16